MSQAFVRANWEAERRKKIRTLELDCEALSSERNDLVTQREIILAESNELDFQKNVLIAERDSIRDERDALLAAQEALLAERQILIAEREALFDQHNLESHANSQPTATSSWRWSAGELHVGDGERIGEKIALIGRSGLLSYGPYAELPPGFYLGCVSVSNIFGEGCLHVRITCAFGEKEVAHHEFKEVENGLIYFLFSLEDTETEEVEIVINSESYDVVMVDFVEIHRRSSDASLESDKFFEIQNTTPRKGWLKRFWK
ncbi:hypothetical protein [Novosphingobium terrae]|uniref:hypothetical protein n=1 Tax=Novosphingobium terrae TaxID=2726189 RepID=UPI001981546F|nr:hypothetical protein [Novosphingobium terrae]